MGARIWFEYVRTKANVADEPSRVDLAGAVYDIGADMPAEVGAALCSAPVAAILPELNAIWGWPLGRWSAARA